MHGNSDPYNREALGHLDIRQWTIKTDNTYLTQRISILSSTATGIAIQRGSVRLYVTGDRPVMLLTLVYSDIGMPVYNLYRRNVQMTE